LPVTLLFERGMTKLKDLKKRFMEDPEFREEYGRIDDDFRSCRWCVKWRASE